MIGQCVQRREGTEETDSGSLAVDVVQVKDHLMKVFGHLLQKDELVNSKTYSSAISILLILHHPPMHLCLSGCGIYTVSAAPNSDRYCTYSPRTTFNN